jgi:hypothetical protein
VWWVRKWYQDNANQLLIEVKEKLERDSFVLSWFNSSWNVFVVKTWYFERLNCVGASAINMQKSAARLKPGFHVFIYLAGKTSLANFPHLD